MSLTRPKQRERPKSGIAEEVWVDIKGWEGLYQISSFGRVKSLARHRRHSCKGDIILKGSIRNQYLGVNLKDKGKEKAKSVHRLVAEAFLPNLHNLPQINHIDGDKLNNTLSNLEWCDASENQIHAIKLGLATHDNTSSKNHYNTKSGFAVSPFGQTFFFECRADFCRMHGLDKAAFQRVMVEKQKTHLGWRKYESYLTK